MSRPVLIRGGEVHDGSGADPRYLDVLLVGDKIAEIGHVDAPSDAEIVNASGLIVAPGFIDVHSHSDYTLLVDPRAVSQITQGVTTEIVGNCGHGCTPYRNPVLGPVAVYGPITSHQRPPESVGGYLEALGAAGPAVNVLTLVPNGQLRLDAVGLEQRPANAPERMVMERALREAMDDGAIGYSTGLEYAQEVGASEAEVIALGRLAGRMGGIYATHTRDRDAGALKAVHEALRIASSAEIPLQISHITPRGGMAMTDACLDAVLTARAAGQVVEFDMHTRTFGFTHLKNLVDLSVLQGNRETILARLSDERERTRIKAARNLITRCGWHRVTLARSRSHPQYANLTFEEIGRELGRDPHDAALDILTADIDVLTYPMVTLQTYTEEQLRRTYLADRCMIGSDATALAPDGPLKNEVFYGAYSWVSWFWQRMVRETASFSPAEAIHRLTALPADVFDIKGRGRLKSGMQADIVLFDAGQFTCNASLARPNVIASGVRDLFVNGIRTIRDGRPTEYRGGHALRRGKL